MSSGPLADVASAIRMDIETRAERITLLATGIYVANTVPAILLGMLAGVWADRWPKRRVMVASNAMRALLVLLAPFCLVPGPLFLGLSWGYWALLVMTFFESVLTQFFAPAEQAAIPSSCHGSCCWLPIPFIRPPAWRPRSWASPWGSRFCDC